MPTDINSIQDALAKASAGLIYMSETDSTFTVVAYPWDPAKPVTLETFRACIGAATDVPAAQVSLDEFFAPAIERGDPADPVIQRQKPGFIQLKATLEKLLRNPTVFKIGKSDIECYAVGLASPTQLAGVSARTVET